MLTRKAILLLYSRALFFLRPSLNGITKRGTKLKFCPLLGCCELGSLGYGTGGIRTLDLPLQIGVSFLTLWTIPSP